MPVVIDASALAEVVGRTDRAPAVEAAFAGQDLIAPDLLNAEVLSVLRGWTTRGLLDPDAAGRAMRNLAAAPVRRFSTAPFIAEMWSLRHDVTPYDAAYVVLARRTGCALLTLDERLRRAPGLSVELRPG